MKTLRNFGLLLLAVTASASWAQQASGEELVEKVVVRNRLFNVQGRFELGANLGFSMLSRLTDHTNLNLSGGYNFLDSLAVELRVGYAISGHTSLANDVGKKFFVQSKTAIANGTDLTDMWEMKFNAIVGLRWQPIYGKLGLLAELPVHFQFYLWAGGGVAMMDRHSVMLCNKEGTVTDPDTGKTSPGCTDYYGESKVSPLVSLAAGFRFFVTNNHAVRLEFRDWSWIDSYLENFNRAAALNQANPTGNGTERSGITNLVQIDIGYTFIF